MKTPGQLFILSIGVLSLLFGCAGPLVYHVSVNSYRSADAERPVSPGATVHVYVDSDNPDLLREEVAAKMEYLLQRNGYSRAPLIQADYIVFFSYVMGSHTETFTKYVYDPSAGAGTTSSSGTSTGSAAGDFLSGFAEGLSKSLASMKPQQASRNVNDRELLVKVLDGQLLRKTGKLDIVWQCQTTSSGSSADLRDVLNYMLIPSFDDFAQDTGKSILHKVRSNDHRVQSLLQNFRTPVIQWWVGMERDQVSQLFRTEETVTGITNPYKVEAFTSPNGSVTEALFYHTKFVSGAGTVEDELTPIILVDAKVVGWGWSFYRDRAQHIDLRVRDE